MSHKSGIKRKRSDSSLSKKPWFFATIPQWQTRSDQWTILSSVFSDRKALSAGWDEMLDFETKRYKILAEIYPGVLSDIVNEYLLCPATRFSRKMDFFNLPTGGKDCYPPDEVLTPLNCLLYDIFVGRAILNEKVEAAISTDSVYALDKPYAQVFCDCMLRTYKKIFDGFFKSHTTDDLICLLVSIAVTQFPSRESTDIGK
jgi:hypothetical protein